jgi:hypothetical protein
VAVGNRRFGYHRYYQPIASLGWVLQTVANPLSLAGAQFARLATKPALANV